MAWHNNERPALARSEKRRARKKFIEAVLATNLSKEEKNLLIQLYSKGH